ncbi:MULTISPECIES: AI-2E family transporter [Paraliobacillus]|uniref:AI-2E family transporter n=1 Tax=Paraliobacillus TaxID=200903 RepID=UPI000DD41DB9|nr:MULTISPECIES: AI-2E family transporter [Paraliobacillus]
MFNQKKIIHWLYWIVFGILLLLFFYLMLKLFPFYHSVLVSLLHISTPFIIASIVAFLLHPLVEKIHTYQIPRWLAITLIYLLFITSIGYIAYHIFPAFVLQLKDLQENLPDFIHTYRTKIYQLYESTSFLPETFHDRMDLFFNEIEEFITQYVTSILKNATKIMDLFIIIAVIPVLVFYMLKDYKLIKSSTAKLIPKRYQEDSKVLGPAINKTLGAYVRGQLLVCLFVGLTTYIIFLIIGMKYPIVLAILMGITNIIPYFGPIIGAVPAVIIAFTISMKQVVYVILGVIVVQLIEGNLLSPYIVGKSVHLHPIIIIFALLVGSEIAGIVGMIVAIPFVTVLKVIVKHMKEFRSTD